MYGMAVMAFCQAIRGEDRAVLSFLAGVCTGKGASHETKQSVFMR